VPAIEKQMLSVSIYLFQSEEEHEQTSFASTVLLMKKSNCCSFLRRLFENQNVPVVTAIKCKDCTQFVKFAFDCAEFPTPLIGSSKDVL